MEILEYWSIGDQIFGVLEIGEFQRTVTYPKKGHMLYIKIEFEDS